MINKVHRFKLNKLIRDNIPDLMRSSGITIYDRVMEREEYEKRLKEKLVEETHEAINAVDSSELLGELADVLEVIYSIAKVYNFTKEDIEEKRKIKRQQKGGFERRIYGAAIEVPPDHPSIAYYRSRPEIYLEETEFESFSS